MAIDINKESLLMEDDDRIEKYIKGLMSEMEEAEFVAELKSNEELRERAIIQAKIIQAMHQVDCEIADAFRNSAIDSFVPSHAKRKVIPLRKWMTVAASVLVFFFLGFKTYDYYHITSVGKEYAISFQADTQIRGNVDDGVQKELSILFTNVEKGKGLSETIITLEKMWNEANSETYNDYTDYAPNIGWNLALAYLQNYEKAKAISVLEQMQKYYPVGTAMGDKVIELLASL